MANKNQQRSKGASRQKQSAGSQSLFVLKVFAVGLVCGVLLSIGVQAFFLSPGDAKTTVAEAAPDTSEPPASANIEEVNARPELTFYETLLNEEVEVPEFEDLPPRPKVISFLQAASFRNREDADRARAQLLLLNFDVNVTEFQSTDATYYRIIVGPFEGQSALAKAQSVLLENGYYDTIPKRVE